MEPDKLVEVKTCDWIELRDVFLLNWPENHIAWHTINNYVNWFRMEPNIRDIKIFSLNGCWRSDGTYVIVVSVCSKISVFEPSDNRSFFECRSAISCSSTHWSCRTKNLKERLVWSIGVGASKLALFWSVIGQLFSTLCTRKSWKSRKTRTIFCFSSRKRKRREKLCCEFVCFAGGVVNHG